MTDRLRRALDNFITGSKRRQQIHGVLGRPNADDSFTFQHESRPDFVHVRIGNIDGSLTPSVARNTGLGRVPLRANLPIVMERINGELVIVGEDYDSGLLENDSGAPGNEFGVTPHPLGSHSDVLLTALADDDVPQWDATAGKWVNVPAPPGPPGAMGGFGGDSVEYVWVDLTGDADPGISTIRFNHATFAGITQIYIDDENLGADDVQDWIAALGASTNTVKGHLRVWKRSNNLVFRTFAVTGVTEATGYWKIDVTPVVSAGASGTLDNGDIVILSFARAGDVGATGAQGDPGDAADIAAEISAATTDDAITDASLWGYVKAGVLVKTAWSNIVATFNGLYVRLTENQTVAGVKTWSNNAIFNALVGIGMTPTVPLHITGTSNTAVVVLANNRWYGGTTAGGSVIRLMTINSTNAVYLGGVDSTGGAPTIIRQNAVDIITISAGNVGIVPSGMTPRGKLDIYDGTGGNPFITKIGVIGTSQTIIPDGTGDVIRGIRTEWLLTDGTSAISGANTLSHTGATSFDITVGGSTWRVTLASNGSLSVARVSGSGTADIAFSLLYL